MNCGAKVLTLISFVLGAISVGTLSLSVATDSWLFTTEPIPHENMTFRIPISTRSGLWRLCMISSFYTERAGDIQNCRMALNQSNYRILTEGTEQTNSSYCKTVSLSVDDEDEGRLPGQKTPLAIMRANRLSTVFLVIALILLVIAAVLSVLGNIRQNMKTLLSAVIYILAGLLLAVGIILYISTINDEVGHRPKTSEDKGDSIPFEYAYGWSFFFAGTAFLTSMLSAVVLVSLYLKRNSRKEEMMEIIPGLEDVLDSDNGQQEQNGVSNPTIIL